MNTRFNDLMEQAAEILSLLNSDIRQNFDLETDYLPRTTIFALMDETLELSRFLLEILPDDRTLN